MTKDRAQKSFGRKGPVATIGMDPEAVEVCGWEVGKMGQAGGGRARHKFRQDSGSSPAAQSSPRTERSLLHIEAW